jgi:hypothetical protein
MYLSIYLLFSKQGSIAMQFVTRSKQSFSATFIQNTGNSVLLRKHFTYLLHLLTSLHVIYFMGEGGREVTQRNFCQKLSMR